MGLIGFGIVVAVLSGSLSFPGYMASEGNKVELTFSKGTDASRPLDQQYGAGSVLYASFLMKVIGTPGTTGAYFFHLMPPTGTYYWLNRMDVENYV
jgi:hypothetical protein